MTLRRRTSLSARLTRMNLLVSGSVLLIAALAFFSYDLFSFRNNLVRNLVAEASIVGQNSVSALMFNDPESAASTLESLKESPDVIGAALTDPNGKTFAMYGNSITIDHARSWKVSGTDQVSLSGARVVVVHLIRFRGKTVGEVRIFARLTEIGHRTRQYLAIAFLILIFCMAAALAISATSKRLIVRPITALAETAMAVSRDSDYTVRANNTEDTSELGLLVYAFNNMLSQIQERDAALQQAHSELETRVAERTRELQAANRELEAFSYTVAHDLRGPLDAITGMVFLLSHANDDIDAQKVQAMLQQMTASTKNMSVLIDDLLNFARAATTPIAPSAVDLSAIANEITKELRAGNPARDVEFQIQATPTILADAGLMHIVLDNLLRNAWKYTSHHSKACIEFGAKTSANRTIYFVRDDGAGFDPSQTDKLFEPFHRLHSNGDFPGTGIGLATVQRILARQGSSIWAEGAVEGGATFYFTQE